MEKEVAIAQPNIAKKPKQSAQYHREYRARKKAEREAKKNSPVNAKRGIQARLIAQKIIEDPTKSVSGAARELGIENVAINPALVTKSVEWNDLLDEMLPTSLALETHRGLLKASHLDHLVFPVNDPPDDDIILMLQEVNCTVRKITHGEQARHVYFFAADNRARKDGLDMLYKLRGSYAMDKAVAFSLVALAASRDTPKPALDGSTQPEGGIVPDVPHSAPTPQLPPATD